METELKFRIRFIYFCTKPTLKEWKLGAPSFLLMFFPRTKPTLKEWKLETPNTSVSLSIRTKPTLKEWKRVMFFTMFLNDSPYEAYLEGMETLAACRLPLRPGPVRSLP